MERYTFIGTLGADAQLRESNGRKFVTFDVAITSKYRDAQGNLQERTKWIGCIRNGTSNADQYLKRGTQVYVEGDVTAKAWQDREGKLQAGVQCHVWKYNLLGGRPRQLPAGQQQGGVGNGLENTPADHRPI